MTPRQPLLAALLLLLLFGCSSKPAPTESVEQAPLGPPPPASSTAGFDASRAYEHVRHLVELGPRPPASEAIHAAQSYLVSQLKSYGCQVEEHDFTASTSIGNVPMKNIVARASGTSPGILLFATHYDTLRMPNFVGADDGGSGTGTMLELARNVCQRKNGLNIWFAFFDGEEAQGNWTDRNSVKWNDANATFGSREMAASMAVSGDLKRLKAMILADMIGPPNLHIKRETNSTQWINDILWSTAARLGYGNVFVNEYFPVTGDDHFSFLHRGVAAADIIDFSILNTYWHTPEDTFEKIDPRSLAVVGHVFLEAIPELEKIAPEKRAP